MADVKVLGEDDGLVRKNDRPGEIDMEHVADDARSASAADLDAEIVGDGDQDELDDLYSLRDAEDDEDDAGSERVVTISWWFPLAAVVVLGLGFALGRALRPPVVAPPPIVEPVEDPSSALIQDPGVTSPKAYHPLLQQAAPDFSLALLADGKPVKLSDYRGKPVLVNFWATWCPPCRYEMPWLQNTYANNKDKGFELIAVDAGERVVPESTSDVVKNFVGQMGLTFPVLLGSNAEAEKVQYDYSVYALPSSFFIDKDGKVVDAHTGMFPSQADLDQRVAQLIGAQ